MVHSLCVFMCLGRIAPQTGACNEVNTMIKEGNKSIEFEACVVCFTQELTERES